MIDSAKSKFRMRAVLGESAVAWPWRLEPRDWSWHYPAWGKLCPL